LVDNLLTFRFSSDVPKHPDAKGPNVQEDSTTRFLGSVIFTGRIDPGELIEEALVRRVLDGSHPFTAHRVFPRGGDPSSWMLSGFDVIRHHRDQKYESFYLVSDGSGAAMLIDVLPEQTDVRITSASEESVTELLGRLDSIDRSLEVPRSGTQSGRTSDHYTW
jgi:hypothetical protein